MEQLKDEFSDNYVPCPKCGKLATSVSKTSNRVFSTNTESQQLSTRNGKVHFSWNSCSVDRTMSEKKV
jgi:hypothetical protein